MPSMTPDSPLFALLELPCCPDQTLLILMGSPVLNTSHIAQLRPHLDSLVFSAMKSGELAPVLKLLRHVKAQLAA